MNAKTKHARVFIFDIAEERKIRNTWPLQFTTVHKSKYQGYLPLLG